MTESEAWHAIEANRHVRPTDRAWLWSWVHTNTGVSIPHAAVCKGHSAPLDMFARQVIERPSMALWHAPRGSGKSFLSAIDTHIASRFSPRHGTRILGGSLAQSEQIHRAITEAIIDGRGPYGHTDKDAIRSAQKRHVHYHNGSEVSILAASPTSVRGPHVPSLKLDEVDEIDPDIRESAMGMAMEVRGVRSSVLMTSTWHRVAGPMADLIARGKDEGAFPVDTYCVFEVLERCPDERSGPDLQHCPECPLLNWCHSDRDERPDRLPKAKRSSGHYTIDSLIQKVKAVSARVFESDYLCLRPKASGVWFTMFEPADHVRESAEFDPRLPVHVAIDCGVHTGAVWFQTMPTHRGHLKVNVFADYFAEGQSAEANARAIAEQSRRLCGVGMERLRVSMDPAGNARTAVGPSVRGEYERAGCRGRNGLESWPASRVADGLSLIEALLRSADGTISLTIHPRCRMLIQAFQSYTRAKRAGQWMDYPEDPQHPHEDVLDPLRGGLKLEHPEGRAPKPALRTMHARSL